jgi:hypothetical protein
MQGADVKSLYLQIPDAARPAMPGIPISVVYKERVSSFLRREWPFLPTAASITARSPAVSSNGAVDSAMLAASSAAADTTSANELLALLAISRGKC